MTMSTTSRIWDEVVFGARDFFHLLVPELPQRIPITWRTFPNTIAFFIPLTFLAYLARRPNTYLIRLLVLPLTLLMTLRSCFGYMWMMPRMNVYNWGEGLACLVSICKALDYTFAKEGRFKVGEKSPGDSQAPAISKKDYDPKDPTKILSNGNGEVRRTGTARPGSSFLPLWFEDAVELMCAFRGVGWDFGKFVYIPPETKPLERRAFLIATLNSFAYNYFALDFIEASLKLIPGVGTPTGASIFLPSLPPIQRYAFSTLIHIASGCALMTGFQIVYDLVTLIGVGLLDHDPTSWPPVLDNPWISTSLNEFWAKRWHQLLRQTFIVMGGIPGKVLAGRIGMVLGTFLASGLYHECASIAMGRNWDNRVVIFFAMQGVFVILERVWRQVTGKRVGGWPGLIWVYFDIMGLGQPMVDAWHMRGLAGGLVIPPIISPTRKFFFPLISHLTGIELNTDRL